MLRTSEKPDVDLEAARHELFELEDPIRRADRLACVIRMVASYGLEVGKGLSIEDADALLQVAYDLLDELGKVRTGYYKAFPGICGPGARS